MKSLIVPGDLAEACRIFAAAGTGSDGSRCTVILSGFPCCVTQTPPTETDGPPGACAIARAALALGHDRVVLATDDCNVDVFRAAAQRLLEEYPDKFSVQGFPASSTTKTEAEDRRLADLAEQCTLLVACERAGPGKDGNCYTMRAINMTANGLIAPLHRLVDMTRNKESGIVPFIAIGDGGNELGMGKVIEKIVSNPKIRDGSTIGCVVPADRLIAASVSNWGGYALAAGAALVRASSSVQQQSENKEAGDVHAVAKEWIDQCVPSERDEIELLDRCVKAGCRDGVSGEMEATVDGMPLEASLQCLRDIRTEK